MHHVGEQHSYLLVLRAGLRPDERGTAAMTETSILQRFSPTCPARRRRRHPTLHDPRSPELSGFSQDRASHSLNSAFITNRSAATWFSRRENRQASRNTSPASLGRRAVHDHSPKSIKAGLNA